MSFAHSLSDFRPSTTITTVSTMCRQDGVFGSSAKCFHLSQCADRSPCFDAVVEVAVVDLLWRSVVVVT